MDHFRGVIKDVEVAKLYTELHEYWLLLEVIKMGDNNKAKEFKLVSYNKDKEKLYELMAKLKS